MKNRKKIILIVALVLLIAVLSVSLTGCLKIKLQKKNVIARITDEGGTYSYLKTSPITGTSVTGHDIEDIILATMVIDEESYDVYIFYCGDDETADWVKEQSDSYLSQKRVEQAEIQRQLDAGEIFIESIDFVDYEHWISYQHERCVMCGYTKALAILRTY